MKPALRLFVVLGAACLARADFDPQHWQTRMPITVKQAGGVSAVVVDAAVYRASRAALRDLRIVHAGVEAPYRLRILSARREQTELQPALLNKAASPNAGVEAVLDLKGHPAHNRLRIATAQHNFKENVRIETSDDARSWAVAREDGLIFDVSRPDRQVSELSVDYPVSTRRYVRLTIPGWHDPAYLASAWLTYFEETGAVRDTVATLTPAATEDPKAQTTALVVDIGFSGVPYDLVEVSVEGETGAFSRSVEVATSGDAKAWLFAGQGAISKAPREEHLSIGFPEQWNRYVRLTLFHGDSAPLKVVRLRLSVFRRLLDFRAAAAGEYWLYAGNPDARRPSYDLAGLRTADADVPNTTLGGAERNPQYRAPERPWTDRNPYVLNFFLLAAVGVMGYMTIRLLRRVKAG
jgi:uncharacterized protein DUF3999